MLPLTSEHSATSSSDHPVLPAHASSAPTGPNDAYPGGDSPEKRSWLRIIIVILCIGGAIGFATYRIVTNKPKPAAGGGGRRGAGGANAIVPVAFDVAQIKTVPITLTALGTVTAYNTVTLKTRVDGQITRINFQEGQRVKKGQLLIEIDRNPYEAALAQAKGNLARDEANSSLAQVQAQRYDQLYAAGVVSKESNQTQTATAGQATGTLAADRAAIEAAQVNLNYTRIVAPIDGVVGLRQVDIGNIVTASSATGLLVLTQVQPISVIFTLPEDQLPAVFEHMHGSRALVAEAWDRSNSTKLATGSLLTVDNQIDTTTGTAKLKAVFQNADNALYPNQFVNIHLVLENRPNSLVVPAAAIQTGNDGSFVYVIDRSQPSQVGGSAGAAATAAGGTAPAAAANTPAATGAAGQPGAAGGRRGAGARGPQTAYPVRVTNVVMDSTQGTMVIIKSGLTAGQQVVTDGQEKLQNNSRVLPRPSEDMMAARAARGAGAAGAAPAGAQGSKKGGAAAADGAHKHGDGNGQDGGGHHKQDTAN